MSCKIKTWWKSEVEKSRVKYIYLDTHFKHEINEGMTVARISQIRINWSCKWSSKRLTSIHKGHRASRRQVFGDGSWDVDRKIQMWIKRNDQSEDWITKLATSKGIHQQLSNRCSCRFSSSLLSYDRLIDTYSIENQSLYIYIFLSLSLSLSLSRLFDFIKAENQYLHLSNITRLENFINLRFKNIIFSACCLCLINTSICILSVDKNR